MVACSRRHGEEIYSEQEIMTLWLHKFEVSRLKPLILTSQRIKRHKSSQVMIHLHPYYGTHDVCLPLTSSGTRCCVNNHNDQWM